MKDKAINAVFSEISDETEKYGFEAFGGKAISYIGWFWRDIDDFDDPPLGILPDGVVGFMANNKWDYDYLGVPDNRKAEFRTACETVATNPNSKTLAALDSIMQSLMQGLDQRDQP